MPTPRTLVTAPHTDFELEVVAGTWPADISGEMRVLEPAATRTTLPYAIFDWGAICRLSLEPGTAAPARTASRGRAAVDPVARQASVGPPPRAVLLGRHRLPLAVRARRTAPNTAPLPWGDRLYTTWDAGRPSSSHPDTLEFVAEVGHVDSWGGSSMPMPGVLPFLFSSRPPGRRPRARLPLDRQARPRHGADLRACARRVVRYDRADGTQVRHWPLDGVTFGGSIHTVSQTRDWVILRDSGNFKADPAEMFGGERSVTIDDEVPVWLIRKDAARGSRVGHPDHPCVLHDVAADRATSTPAGTTPTASRSCGRAWTSWTSPSTCGPTTST